MRSRGFPLNVQLHLRLFHFFGLFNLPSLFHLFSLFDVIGLILILDDLFWFHVWCGCVTARQRTRLQLADDAVEGLPGAGAVDADGSSWPFCLRLHPMNCKALVESF